MHHEEAALEVQNSNQLSQWTARELATTWSEYRVTRKVKLAKKLKNVIHQVKLITTL
jgi:hypothetical protein